MSVYKKSDSKFWWYSFKFAGRRIQRSTKVENKREAENIEKAAWTQLARGEVGLEERPRYTVGELLDRLKQRWQLEGKASVQNLSLLKKAKADFGNKQADEITTQYLEGYALRRRKEKYANASTNRIFQCVRRSCNLAGIAWPKFELLDEKDNVREGVFGREEFQKVVGNLPDDGLRDFVRFAYSTGMRRGELAALRWSFVHGDHIIVPAEVCKNRRPHKIPVAGPLIEIIERQRAARAVKVDGTTQLSEYIFHRGDGLPIGDFKKSWRTACTKAGCGNRIFHDLRRTSISDMLAAGVPQSVCMSISGHKTISVFLRYAISSDESKSEALEKTAAYRAG